MENYSRRERMLRRRRRRYLGINIEKIGQFEEYPRVFFRIGNTRKGMKVVINIINLAKPDSLYNYGMKVLNFSNKLND